jgi:hypothetical protein
MIMPKLRSIAVERITNKVLLHGQVLLVDGEPEVRAGVVRGVVRRVVRGVVDVFDVVVPVVREIFQIEGVEVVRVVR